MFLLVTAPFGIASAEQGVRVGFFPNITHAQALVASNMSREGKGWFESRLGEPVKLEWSIYNAGPSAMEAFFTKAIDMTYVGPSPVVNAHARANGKEVRVMAGSMRGGEALVVRGDTITSVDDLRGKTIATPQLGNTQDVECRAWLLKQGIKVTLVGGDARVAAISAASILAKTTRDARMRELALEHPGYGFERHMGYPTREHFAALERLGPCAAHRRSFAPVARACERIRGA